MNRFLLSLLLAFSLLVPLALPGCTGGNEEEDLSGANSVVLPKRDGEETSSDDGETTVEETRPDEEEPEEEEESEETESEESTSEEESESETETDEEESTEETETVGPISEKHLIGVYPFESVVDGDTIRLKGARTSIRVLFLDTEETFRFGQASRAEKKGFDAYAKEERGDSPRPVKYGTPLGEAAKEWAKEFFADVDEVRLESDQENVVEGYYGRLLGIPFVKRDGRWVNYSVECVRAGMSPYFCKYGYSTRFHDEFVAAQKEAREAKRGIWDPDRKHYPDYEERLTWWRGRAEVLRTFDEKFADREDVIRLTDHDAAERLKAHIGEEVTVFGVVDKILTNHKPYLARLSHRKGDDLQVACFELDVWHEVDWDSLVDEYAFVRGRLKMHKGHVNIILRHPSQIHPGDQPPE